MNKLVNFVISYRFEFNINGCSGSLQCFHIVGLAMCNRKALWKSAPITLNGSVLGYLAHPGMTVNTEDQLNNTLSVYLFGIDDYLILPSVSNLIIVYWHLASETEYLPSLANCMQT